MNQHTSTDRRPILQQVSVVFEGTQYYGSYIYDDGVVTVGWNNATDYTLHQMSAETSDPRSEARRLLRRLLLAARFRGEL